MVPYVRKSFKKHALRRAFTEFVYNTPEEKELSDELREYISKYPVVDEWFSLEPSVIKDITKAFDAWYLKANGLTDEDFVFGSSKIPRRVRNEAYYDTEEESRQAIEAFLHNMNTLMSRSGNQLPFSSVNTGTCTLPEGRMITELLLRAYLEGTGTKHSTPIFPCFIFVLKDGINKKPGDPNYDLFRLALECTAKRLYPNYANGDWSAQKSWLKQDRDMKRDYLETLSDTDRELLTARISQDPEAAYKLTLLIEDGKLVVDDAERPNEQFSTMGCVRGDSIIDYKINEERFVETFERAWARLAGIYTVETQPNGFDSYIDTPAVSIWDCVRHEYVAQTRIIRNTSNQWISVAFSGGRYIDVTTDHPFEVIDRGVVYASDLHIGDRVHRDVCAAQDSSDAAFDIQAWLAGLVMCDASIAGSLNLALGLDEKDILDKAEEGFKGLGYQCTRREQHRGPKGDYAELYVRNSKKLCDEYATEFEGNKKLERKVPNSIFSATREEKLSFMAGMIDADGYVNNSGNTIRVQLGSTNQEIALGQLLLAKDIGLNGVVYKNHYSGSDPSKIRYRVEFPATYELFSYLVSSKKRAHLSETHKFAAWGGIDSDVCEVTGISPYEMDAFSYDVTTESGHFTVNGVYSHNCRTANGFDINALQCYKIAIQQAISGLPITMDLLSGAQKDGRGNICPVTIILPELAMIANKDVEVFMQVLEQKIEEAWSMLLERYEWICSQPAISARFTYENHVLAGYIPEEGVRSALQHGTIVIGQLGLAEALQLLIGKDHTSPEGMELAKRIEQLFKDKISEYRQKYKLNGGVYYSPAESLCHTALKKFRDKYGVIPNVSDKEYFTNSMHVPVHKRVNAFEKADIESQLTGYSSAGCIWYFETEVNIRYNLDGLEKCILYAIDKDIPYIGVNVTNDQCQDCGYLGDIPGACPKCGSNNVMRLRRVTGYLSTTYEHFNLGKQDETLHRVKHNG